MNTSEVPVLTVDEAAEYLRIPKSSLYKLAQEGKIPCKKVGRRWIFHRQVIDNWLGNSRQSNKKPEE
jgi:excisionase family DNA binding protein